MHNPNNKECHLNHCVGYKGDNYCLGGLDHCLGGLDCICTCPPEQKEEWEEEFGVDSEWLIPLYTDEVSVEDKKIAVRRLIALAEERVQKNMADELLQIVIEDVPHQYQARILSTLTQKL